MHVHMEIICMYTWKYHAYTHGNIMHIHMEILCMYTWKYHAYINAYIFIRKPKSEDEITHEQTNGYIRNEKKDKHILSVLSRH
jgi:hypothetical protein